jgi:hypothetical protein
MVTVQIIWDGTEDTRDDRINYVKKVITGLGCKPTSPVETYDIHYICGDVIINLTSGIGELSVWVKGVDKGVFNFVAPIVDMIHGFISKYVEDGKWSNDSYETRVSLDLYEAETTCRCEV